MNIFETVCEAHNCLSYLAVAIKSDDYVPNKIRFNRFTFRLQKIKFLLFGNRSYFFYLATCFILFSFNKVYRKELKYSRYIRHLVISRFSLGHIDVLSLVVTLEKFQQEKNLE